MMTSAGEIARRAGGRRRYNARRKLEAIARRLQVIEILGAGVILPAPGMQSLVARVLRVHRSTICRDIEAIRAEWRQYKICSRCGKIPDLPQRVLARLETIQRRQNPALELSCCAADFLRKEAKRKKKRASKLEMHYRRVVENL